MACGSFGFLGKAVHFVLTKMHSPAPHAREALTQHHVRVQVVLVSATLPHEVLEMTHKFMTEPLRVLVKRDELTLEARPAALKETSGFIGLKCWGMTHKFVSNTSRCALLQRSGSVMCMSPTVTVSLIHALDVGKCVHHLTRQLSMSLHVQQQPEKTFQS